MSQSSRKLTFNTGRLYTIQGQLITVEIHEDHVLFKDHSRMICGRTHNAPPLGIDIPEWLMQEYDARRYLMDITASCLDPEPNVMELKL